MNKLIHRINVSTNPSAPAGYDTRPIFKRSLTGLSSKCFFLIMTGNDYSDSLKECPRGVMVKAMDYGIVVSEFAL